MKILDLEFILYKSLRIVILMLYCLIKSEDRKVREIKLLILRWILLLSDLNYFYLDFILFSNSMLFTVIFLYLYNAGKLKYIKTKSSLIELLFLKLKI